MVRRKVPRHGPQTTSSTANSPTSKDHLSARDYYNRRYEEVDKKRRCRGLYEGSTESHRDRMEALWREYVDCPPFMLRGFPADHESFQVLQNGGYRPISHAQKGFCREDQQLLPLGVQRVHCGESQLCNHVLASAQPSIYQMQGETDQSAGAEESLRGMLPNTGALSKANKEGSVHRWTSSQRAWLGRQRDRQTPVRCGRLPGGASVPLGDGHQFFSARTPPVAGRHYPATGRGHRFPPGGAAGDHLRRYRFVCATR